MQDNFLDLGGDSLTGMRVVMRLQQQLDCLLPAAILLTETETVEEMAKVIVATLGT